MLAQYKSIKKEHPDALLFFRMGDFYELFFEDAVTASAELQIALTSRGKSGGNAAPMCGVPWHASQSYIAQLIDKGYNVAICEQIEDAKNKKGLVARAVTQVITPGTILDDANLGVKRHNYLGAIFCGMHDSCGFAWADISTGQWSGLEFRKQADLWQWVKKLSPSELLLVDGQQLPPGFAQENMRLAHQPPVNFELKRATERLLAAQGTRDLQSLGLEGKPGLIRACGAILAYLDQTQIRSPGQLAPFKPLDLGRRLIIDELTERNLEIFTTLGGRKGKGTLLHAMDDTVTPMGGRLLEDMLRHPWRDLKIIRQIQECVSFFCGNDDLRGKLRSLLKRVLDLERIEMRVCVNKATPRDIFAFRQSVAALSDLEKIFAPVPMQSVPTALSRALGGMDSLADIKKFLEKALIENFSDSDGEYGIFQPGWNAELDRQRDLLAHGDRNLEELLEAERQATGLTRLKAGYNRNFGYYFEIGKASLGDRIPEHFQRKQSLVNAERFTTPDLAQLEEDILQAEERRRELESEMYANLIAHLAAQKERVLQCADVLANLDYWQSLAETGRREAWSIPELDESCDVHIAEGRHPVVESIIGRANFVANDFHLDGQRRLCLLTGPNMAGKSTILRQVAIIALLAQMGSMVPASSARLGVVDRLFSRVGASDNLGQGQSTFMVEMMETARILRQAGKRSLIILDELGRGTSTYDGMALAWAVVEDLASRCQGQLRTIFATHYHELTALEGVVPGLFTMNISIGDYGPNEILFLHRLLYGPSDKSYGVEVARLAGVPYPVVQRARDILKQLEQKRDKHTVESIALPGLAKKAAKPSFEKELGSLNLEAMQPEEALKILQTWQKALRQ